MLAQKNRRDGWRSLPTKGIVRPMPHAPHDFACPLCDAAFKVVLVEAGPESNDANVACPACATEFSGRAPGKVLKYFLVAEPG
jgi:transcription elongation factor Elf1